MPRLSFFPAPSADDAEEALKRALRVAEAAVTGHEQRADDLYESASQLMRLGQGERIEAFRAARIRDRIVDFLSSN